MTKRAVLYARVSYDDRGNEALNLQGQLEMGREYALGRGYRIEDEIAEDERGARGAAFDLPGLNRALEIAHRGEFEVLIVRELDRFARRLAKQLIVEEEFKRAGVAIEYVLGEYPDTPEGNLNKNIRAVIAEFEALKIAERLRRGHRRKVSAGSVMVYQNPPYGYDAVEKGGKWALEICESEAEAVRMIFAWYTEGDVENGPMTIAAITRKLTAMSISTFADTGKRRIGPKTKRRRGEWGRSSVHGILTNETYAGLWRFGKRKNPGGQWMRNPEEYQLTVRVPAIVERETWEEAQLRLAHNRQCWNRSRKHQYLMSGHVTCGSCGLKMAGTSNRKGPQAALYYRCPATRSAGRVAYARDCSAPLFNAGHVDQAVWNWVTQLLSEPAVLIRGLGEYQDRCENGTDPIRKRLSDVEGRIAKNKARLGRLLDEYLDGIFSKAMLEERRKRIEGALQANEKERANLLATLELRDLAQEQLRSLERFAAEVTEGLAAMADDFESRQRVIDALNVQTVLAVEDDDKALYVSCGLDLPKVDQSPVAQVLLDTGHHGFTLTKRIILPKSARRKRSPERRN